MERNTALSAFCFLYPESTKNGLNPQSYLTVFFCLFKQINRGPISLDFKNHLAVHLDDKCCGGEMGLLLLLGSWNSLPHTWQASLVILQVFLSGKRQSGGVAYILPAPVKRGVYS